MNTEKKSKINTLLSTIPSGVALTTAWLTKQGYSLDLQKQYKKSQWLNSIGTGALIRNGDQVDYLGGLYALQSQLGLSIHPGAKTALSLQGKAHYLGLAEKKVMLFGTLGEKLPMWFDKHDWGVNIDCKLSSFLPPDLGLVEIEHKSFSVKVSGPARAIMECLYLAPKSQPLMEVYELMESLNNLRPATVQKLLESCSSVKVKRLFLYLADKAGHEWLSYINIQNIDLGTGKRSIVEGGIYIPEYRITVPKETGSCAMNKAYKKQVQLLLDMLPEVAKERCFAMHGGTAINLFLRDMPRLSVDIDLTYVDIAERAASLAAINEALIRILRRIEALRPSIHVLHRAEVCKLQVAEHETIIKIEVNMIGRGLLGEQVIMQLCGSAQEEFDSFCAMPIVSVAQLYGGKLCAALDRQHPRDLFDVKLLLEAEGFTKEIKRGLILGLVSSNRPTYEMLDPHLQDQRIAFENQFEDMSTIKFSYEDYEATRATLIETVKTSLTEDDKAFLLSLNRLEPDWTIYDYQSFPSVRWKMLNLEKFKKENPEAWHEQLEKLQVVLNANVP